MPPARGKRVVEEDRSKVLTANDSINRLPRTPISTDLKDVTVSQSGKKTLSTDVDAFDNLLKRLKGVKIDDKPTITSTSTPPSKKIVINEIEESPFVIPSLTYATTLTPSRPPPTPLFLDDESDSENDIIPLEPPPKIPPVIYDVPESEDSDDGWKPSQRRKGKAKRIVRDPDSDDDSDGDDTNHRADLRRSPSCSSSPTSAPIRTTEKTEAPKKRKEQVKRREIAKFFDIEARGSRSESEKEDSGAEEEYPKTGKANDREFRSKYYDDSIGSLKDFIVDDDYESSGCSSSEENSEIEIVERRPKPSKQDRGSKGSKGIKGSRKQPQEVIEVNSDSEKDSQTPNGILSDSEGDDRIEDILHYSPAPSRLHHITTLPDISTLIIYTPPSSPPSKSSRIVPIPPTPKTPASKKAWGVQREKIAQDIFEELDKKVFDKKLGKDGAGTVLEWNKRLLTTAGTAQSKRSKHSDGTSTEVLKIMLSEKVLTGEAQILATVAHEMCHIATWVISNEKKNPHGKIFKSWGRKVMRVRPDIEVTTKHEYEIEYKFEWQCLNKSCGKIYKRHSKSIDVDKQACGKCKSKLKPLFESKKETSFQAYLKENMKLAKSAMPGSSHGEVMRALSRQWTDGGPEGDHKLFWESMAKAAK